MDNEFVTWFNSYWSKWEVGPDTYSREEAEEIAFAAWQAAEQSVQPTGLTAAQKEEVRQMIQSALNTGSA